MRAALIATALFLVVSALVLNGRTAEFDSTLLRSMRVPESPAWIGVVVRDVTALGGYSVLTLAATFSVAVTLGLKWYREPILIAAAGLGGVVVSNLLKMWFDRVRPDEFGHLDHVESLSYPSGHAMMATAIWVTLAVVFGRRAGSRRVRAGLVVMAVIVAVLVGLSRISLSVHWPTDVLGGWAAGLAWALALGRIILNPSTSPKRTAVSGDYTPT